MIKILLCLSMIYASPSFANDVEGGKGTGESKEIESSSVSEGSETQIKGFGLRDSSKKPKKRKKKRRRSKKKLKKTPSSNSSSFKMGLGVQSGWEAPYGNGAVAHFILSDKIDINAGVGYNNSGLKLGSGVHFLVSVSDAFKLRFGASIIRSQGRKGDVDLEAKFTPEGSGSAESLQTSKSFEVSPATIVSPSMGASLFLGPSFAIVGGVNYNKILNGNEATFGDDISYSKNVELSNQGEFDKKFDEEAKGLVQAGGIGFHAGLMILL